MIVVQIHSGLGNQLFMYAAARALAQRRSTALYLDVDTDCREGVNFGERIGHSFQLDKFNIRAGYLGMDAIKMEGPPSTVGFYSAVKTQLRDIRVLRSAVRLLRYKGIDISKMAMKMSGTDKRMFVEDRGDWGYKPHFLDLPDDTILRGCFFSYRYFDWMRDMLLDELSLKKGLSFRSKEIEEEILGGESVSLHVRRGDTITNPEYHSWYEGVVTDRYYRNAIAHFTQRLERPHFFVFSDDMAWTKANLRIPGKVTYVDHNGPEKGYEDLHLMSRCKHNVTAGFSSFSWWAAYLNRNPQKIVVRTERMNGLDALNHPEDFFPSSWVVVPS
ncbi:alpha-1,2-fucosyltransferase [Noviherbaspirillum agri]